MNKLFYGAALIILAACHTKTRKAQLTITNPAIDLSEVQLDSTYYVRYSMHNTGDAELVVDTVSASCGCTIPDKTKYTIRPADSASLIVNFKPPEPGAFEKKIIIKSNTDSTFTVVSFYGIAKNKIGQNEAAH